jgi:hypothetical protein
MAEDEKDGLEQGKKKAGPPALSLEEKERLLEELQKIFDRLAQGGGAASCDPDGALSHFSFGLGIDPNG